MFARSATTQQTQRYVFDVAMAALLATHPNVSAALLDSACTTWDASMFALRTTIVLKEVAYSVRMYV